MISLTLSFWRRFLGHSVDKMCSEIDVKSYREVRASADNRRNVTKDLLCPWLELCHIFLLPTSTTGHFETFWSAESENHWETGRHHKIANQSDGEQGGRTEEFENFCSEEWSWVYHADNCWDGAEMLFFCFIQNLFSGTSPQENPSCRAVKSVSDREDFCRNVII